MTNATLDPSAALGRHSDIIGRPTFSGRRLTHAWIRRDVSADAFAALLADPVATHLEEIALYGGQDSEPILSAIATNRPSTLVSIRFGATEPVDFGDWWPHLAAFERLALSGPVHTGVIQAPRLRFLGWVDRRGTRVSFAPSTVGLQEVWMRTPRDAGQAFLDAVQTPQLRKITLDGKLDAAWVTSVCERKAQWTSLRELRARDLTPAHPAYGPLRQAFPEVTIGEARP